MLALPGSPPGSIAASETETLQRSSSAILHEKEYPDGTDVGLMSGKLVFSNPDLSLEDDDLEVNINNVYSPRRNSIGRLPAKLRGSSWPSGDFTSADMTNGGNANASHASPVDSGVDEMETNCSDDSPFPLLLPSDHVSTCTLDVHTLTNSRQPDVAPPLPESQPPDIVMVTQPLDGLPEDTHGREFDVDCNTDGHALPLKQQSIPSEMGLNQLLPIFENGSERACENGKDLSPAHSASLCDNRETLMDAKLGWNRKRGHRRDWSDVTWTCSVPGSIGGLRGDLVGDVVLEVNMASANRCGGCQALLFDEQIMSRWSSHDSDFTTR